jgi:cell division septum initiation protein DivIVA
VGEEKHTSDEAGEKTEFSIVRKGYEPVEVQEYLSEYDQAFRDLEEYAARLKHDLNEAKLHIARLEAAEQESIDNAMLAVFDAKDRIIEGAMEKARKIEEAARRNAGLPVEEPEPTPEPTVTVGETIGLKLLDELTEVVGEDGAGPVGPNEVLQQMLHEADVIRERLDTGLAAAFEQMEQMQREAEARAQELLSAARSEADRLRSAGESPTIQVSLAESDGGPKSRYSKNSASLPRIGEDDNGSVLAQMNSLRARMREEGEADDQEPVSSHDAIG